MGTNESSSLRGSFLLMFALLYVLLLAKLS